MSEILRNVSGNVGSTSGDNGSMGENSSVIRSFFPEDNVSCGNSRRSIY